MEIISVNEISVNTKTKVRLWFAVSKRNQINFKTFIYHLLGIVFKLVLISSYYFVQQL